MDENQERSRWWYTNFWLPAARYRVWEFRTIHLSEKYDDRAFKFKKSDIVAFQGRITGKYKADYFSETFDVPVYNYDGTILLKSGKGDQFRISSLDTLSFFGYLKRSLESKLPWKRKKQEKTDEAAFLVEELDSEKRHEKLISELRGLREEMASLGNKVEEQALKVQELVEEFSYQMNLVADQEEVLLALVEAVNEDKKRLGDIMEKHQELAAMMDKLAVNSAGSNEMLGMLLSRSFTSDLKTEAYLKGGTMGEGGYVVQHPFKLILKIQSTRPLKFVQLKSPLPIRKFTSRGLKGLFGQAESPMAKEIDVDFSVSPLKSLKIEMEVEPPDPDEQALFSVDFTGTTEIKGQTIPLDLKSEAMVLEYGSVAKERVKKMLKWGVNFMKQQVGKLIP
ncbi:MAG: hypothetical protein ACTSU5_16095 [Promethearchaeota archaeon]